MDLAQVLMQVNQQNAARRARYMAPASQLDADGQLPLDHPSLAGTNPVIDALIAQTTASEQAMQQQLGGISPLDLAGALVQEPQGAQGALRQISQLPGATGQMPFANDPSSILASLGGGNNPTDIVAALLGVDPQAPAPAQAPAQVPTQAAPAAVPQQSASVGSELYQMQIPQIESAPKIGDILNEASTSQNGQVAGQGSGPQSTEVSLAALLNDPGMARLLVSMGSSLTQGNSFATAIQQGLATKDAFNSAVSESAYTTKKREADLTKTSAEVVKMIAEAGQSKDLGEKNRADARKATVEAGMAGYNAETDRLKAQASQLSANAAYKTAVTTAEKELRKLDGKEPMTDKEYSQIYSDMLLAMQNNPLLTAELQEKGMTTAEMSTMLLNRTVSKENMRLIPMSASRAATLKRTNDELNALPDTPENQEKADKFRTQVKEELQFVYGIDALIKALEGN